MSRSYELRDGKPNVVDHGAINLGIAVDVEKKDGSRSLMVPCIRAADQDDFRAFHTKYEDLIRKTRENALTADDFLASVGFRREHSGLGPNKVIAGPAIGNGAMVWLGTNPGPAGKLADDDMSEFNGYGLSQPDADETAKRGLAHR